jgi:hypothetical protein
MNVDDREVAESVSRQEYDCGWDLWRSRAGPVAEQGAMQQTVEDRIGQGWVDDGLVPVFNV